MDLSLALRSVSRAQDAGYLALADVARLAHRLTVEYRLVGGHMVSLYVAAYGAQRAPLRETADADMAATFDVLADPRLVPALRDLGYAPVSGNRFRRVDGRGLALVVDLLAPSFTGTHNPNMPVGELVVDEVPGLSLALAVPPLNLSLDVTTSDHSALHTEVAVPALMPALALKALAYASRLQTRDAVDVWRLLEVAEVAELDPGEWAGDGVRADARQALHHWFSRRDSAGTEQASADMATRTRVAALVQRRVPA